MFLQDAPQSLVGKATQNQHPVTCAENHPVSWECHEPGQPGPGNSGAQEEVIGELRSIGRLYWQFNTN